MRALQTGSRPPLPAPRRGAVRALQPGPRQRLQARGAKLDGPQAPEGAERTIH